MMYLLQISQCLVWPIVSVMQEQLSPTLNFACSPKIDYEFVKPSFAEKSVAKIDSDSILMTFATVVLCWFQTIYHSIYYDIIYTFKKYKTFFHVDIQLYPHEWKIEK